MKIESDEEMLSRRQRQKAVQKAWQKFRQSADRKTRKKLKRLPNANPHPKSIIVTHNRVTDPFAVGWKAGSST